MESLSLLINSLLLVFVVGALVYAYIRRPKQPKGLKKIYTFEEGQQLELRGWNTAMQKVEQVQTSGMPFRVHLPPGTNMYVCGVWAKREDLPPLGGKKDDN